MNLLGSFQFNNAAIATALFLLWLRAGAAGRSCRRDRSRRAIGPARHALARPARGHRSRTRSPSSTSAIRPTASGNRSRASRPSTARRAGFSSSGCRATRRPTRSSALLAPSFDTIVCTARVSQRRGRRDTSPRRRGRPIRQPPFTSPRRSRTPCKSAGRWRNRWAERFSSPADYSSPSNTPLPRGAAGAGAGFFLNSSFRGAQRERRNP